MSRRRFGAFLLSAPMALPALWAARAQSIMATETLTITTASGPHRFEVEIARTDEEQARGLMGRRYLPADRGMIFDYPDVRPVSMWMENTFISLDMLFVDAEGKIVRIAERAEPLSRRFIPSGAPVRAVVELNAGTAARIGAKVGDRIAISFIGGG
ncbi:DUF192 domain-containing protein [Pseudochelatococcus sp. B33]